MRKIVIEIITTCMISYIIVKLRNRLLEFRDSLEDMNALAHFR